MTAAAQSGDALDQIESYLVELVARLNHIMLHPDEAKTIANCREADRLARDALKIIDIAQRGKTQCPSSTAANSPLPLWALRDSMGA